MKKQIITTTFLSLFIFTFAFAVNKPVQIDLTDQITAEQVINLNIKQLEKETGKTFEEIKTSKGSLRQIAMDLLYRVGGFKGVEIGKIFGVDYSTVSQGRKRLREKMQKDLRLNQIINHIEKNLSLLKN